MDPRDRRLPLPPARQIPRAPRAASAGLPVEEDLPPAARGPSFEPGTEIGDFQLVREIARSPNGFIFEARQRPRERLVALKLFSPALQASPRAAARFREEAALAARVIHPGILPVLAVGEEGVNSFYAMALPTGPTLAQFIEEALGTRGEAFFREAALRFADLARAVETLHRSGILHRRIEPATLSLEGDRLVLGGFELALDLAAPPREAEGSGPETGGRPEDLFAPDEPLPGRLHAAPEEFVPHSPLDPRADLYSLGMSLYELCTGICPFPSCSFEELARLKLTRCPMVPRRLNPEVPLGLEAVIRQATEASPHLRHPSAAELARDLERFAARKRGLTRRHDAPGRGEEEGGGEGLEDLARIA